MPDGGVRAQWVDHRERGHFHLESDQLRSYMYKIGVNTKTQICIAVHQQDTREPYAPNYIDIGLALYNSDRAILLKLSPAGIDRQAIVEAELEFGEYSHKIMIFFS